MKELRSKYIEYRNTNNESLIREQLHHGRTRVLCYDAYGDPYPREMKDMQRVLKQGAGYTKRGKVHQKWSKREGKFHSHDKRQEKMQTFGATKYKKLARKPGEYDLPTFDSHNTEQLMPSALSELKKNMRIMEQKNKTLEDSNARKWQKFTKSNKEKDENNNGIGTTDANIDNGNEVEDNHIVVGDGDGDEDGTNSESANDPDTGSK